SYHDHPTSAHFGVQRTWSKLKDRCYWPKMKSTIENYIHACEKCSRFNINRKKPPGKLVPINPPQ
ncbi:unnamed protein product, partial [Didymodactylos carnosus]